MKLKIIKGLIIKLQGWGEREKEKRKKRWSATNYYCNHHTCCSRSPNIVTEANISLLNGGSYTTWKARR